MLVTVYLLLYTMICFCTCTAESVHVNPDTPLPVARYTGHVKGGAVVATNRSCTSNLYSKFWATHCPSSSQVVYIGYSLSFVMTMLCTHFKALARSNNPAGPVGDVSSTIMMECLAWYQ